MKIPKPEFRILYNSKNITEEVTSDLISVTYTDKVEGESDEIEIRVQDTEGKWINTWFPGKGDSLELSFGYNGNLVKGGTFEIDEIEPSGPPDIVVIRGLAAGINSSSRTKTSTAFEDLTFREIVQQVAKRNGWTVSGTIPQIQFQRVTQNQETDLAFLRRLGGEYGCLFSIRGKQLIFTSIYEIDRGRAVVSIDRTQFINYAFRDKTTETYKSVRITYHDPKTKAVVSHEENQGTTGNGGVEYDPIVTENTLELRSRAETKQQAEAKAKAALHRANSKQVEGELTVVGNPILVAGNNIEVTGMGVLSGKYQIQESSHTIDRSGGYTTRIPIKKVGTVLESKKQPAKPRPVNKPVQPPAQLPRRTPPFDSSISGF